MFETNSCLGFLPSRGKFPWHQSAYDNTHCGWGDDYELAEDKERTSSKSDHSIIYQPSGRKYENKGKNNLASDWLNKHFHYSLPFPTFHFNSNIETFSLYFYWMDTFLSTIHLLLIGIAIEWINSKLKLIDFDVERWEQQVIYVTLLQLQKYYFLYCFCQPYIRVPEMDRKKFLYYFNYERKRNDAIMYTIRKT